MFQESYFTFDGISSESLGVIAARTDNNMFSRTFAKRRDIITEKVQHNPLPFDFGFDTDTLQGSITIAGRETALDAHKLAKIASWLYQDEYKPLISDDNPDIIFYVKFMDEQELYLGAHDQGYITLSFTANAPWGWSRPYEYTVDLRKKSEAEITVNNVGNANDYNGLSVDIAMPTGDENGKGATQIAISDEYTIRNIRNTKADDAFILNKNYTIDTNVIEKYNLKYGETIHIDMQNKRVESDDTYAPVKLKNCNKKWVKLVEGRNQLSLKGNGIFTVRCQYPIVI